jgi:hypothetical protein
VNSNYSAREFVQLLRARLYACESITLSDRDISAKPNPAKKLWVIRRSAGESPGSLFDDDTQAQTSMELVEGGIAELDIIIRETKARTIELSSYRIAFEELPPNPSGMNSIRFELDCLGRRGDGWDEELLDNPEHPLSHFHINYLAGNGANDCRLPAGPLCPILLLRSFDYWYCSCFNRKK